MDERHIPTQYGKAPSSTPPQSAPTQQYVDPHPIPSGPLDGAQTVGYIGPSRNDQRVGGSYRNPQPQSQRFAQTQHAQAPYPQTQYLQDGPPVPARGYYPVPTNNPYGQHTPGMPPGSVGVQNHVNVVVAQAPSNGLGTGGFVLGLLGFLFCWLPYLGSLICILGLGLSGAGMTKQPRGLAIAGLVLSLIGLIGSLIFWVNFWSMVIV